MKQTPVCGINGPLTDASSEALERLLGQFGRNGSLSGTQAVKKSKVEAVLQSRRGLSVVICDQGFRHPI